MGKLLLMLMVVCVLLISGCTGDDNGVGNNDTPVVEGDILPLAVGNVWSGKLAVTTIYDTTSVDVVYFVTSDSVVNSETWYRIKAKSQGTTNFFGWFTSRADGVYMISDEDRLGLDTPQLLFKSPANVGDTYDSYLFGVNYDVEIVSHNSQITVPGGQHACCLFELETSGGMSDLYMSPNTGFVKIESFTSQYSYHSVWELDSLVLK